MSNNPGLIKNWTAGGTVNNYRIVAYGAGDVAIQAANQASRIIGVSKLPQNASAVVSGDRFDVVHADLCFVEYGGTITRGDWLMAASDGSGKAVAWSSGSGYADARTIGFAWESGVSGDIGSVFLSQGETWTPIRSYIADGAITAGYLVKPGSADTKVAVATASTSNVLGVALDTVVDGATVRVQFAGVASVVTSGTIAVGAPFVSNASGVAVAVGAGAANSRIGGFALTGGTTTPRLALIAPAEIYRGA